jgi:hypothetical protein
MPHVPMHPRMIRISEDAAVITLSEAARMLNPPEPDPLNDIAFQADTDPGAIRDMANQLTNGTNRLNEGNSYLYGAFRIMTIAWKGRRALAWKSHADTVLNYYKPSGLFRRNKQGVWTLADQTARATAAIGVDLDQATITVANALLTFANQVNPSAVAVVQGRGTPEDEYNVRMAVAAIQKSLTDFDAQVSSIASERLIKPNLVDEFPFADQGAGMAQDPTEDNQLSIRFPDFDDALAKLDMATTQASLAGEDITAAAKITSLNGQSPFGGSPTAIAELQMTWALTVTSRAIEAEQVMTQTQQLKATAAQAEEDYLDVENRTADSFRVIYRDE